MKIHHVALSVTDVAVSAEWYATNLGFRKIDGISRDFGTFILMESEAGDRIELIQAPQPTPLPVERKEIVSDIKHVGIKHFCLEVNDIDQALKRLAANGVEQTREVGDAFYGAKYTFIADPDGNLIEIVELNSKGERS